MKKKKRKSPKKLTDDDIRLIRDNYLAKSYSQLAKEIGAGVSHNRVKRIINRMGLNVPDDIIKHRIKSNKFKDGHIPFNKGKKANDYLDEEVIKRIAKGQFKKGNIPKNTKPDGTISTRRNTKYKYIKVGNTWVLYRRYLYEKHYGNIPEDCLVVLKDGINEDDLTYMDLKLITKAEHIYRHGAQDYPEEVIPSLILVNKLEKEIKKLSKNGKV